MGLVHFTAVPVNSLEFTVPTQRVNGQVELTWVTGYIPRWFAHLTNHY